jgi:hypothetical protein
LEKVAKSEKPTGYANILMGAGNAKKACIGKIKV